MYQIHAKAKKGVEMPLCDFGLACNRANCVYRHPKGKRIQKNEENICVAHVLNKCAYGEKCIKKHISEEDAKKLIEKNSVIPCRYGLKCLNEDCLFLHEEQGSRLNVRTIKEALNNELNAGVSVDLRSGRLLPATIVQGSSIIPPLKIEQEENVLNKAPAVAPVIPITFPKSEGLLKKQQQQNEAGGNINLDSEHELKQYREYQFIKLPSVPLPKEFERNPALFTIMLDPKERFLEVNKDFYMKKGVLDLHYQKIDEVAAVYEYAMEIYIRNEFFCEKFPGCVFVFTGIGNHTKEKNRMLVFDEMFYYLRQKRVSFKIVKDEYTAKPGGFLVSVR